jgi:hypothetical protein
MVTLVFPGKCRRIIIQISETIYQPIKGNKIHWITGNNQHWHLSQQSPFYSHRI